VQSSTYTTDAHAQADGRIGVTELHTDTAGRVHRVYYRAPAAWGATEINAILSRRAAEIDARLAEAEAIALMEQG